ncbi:helix-turn-helix transcriptional regulator, partial [Acinetobacter baumannii]
MKESIGYRIRKLREQKDYTQDNMGAELGITPGAYAKIERDETDPSASRLIQ